jgi:N-acetyl-1-D-myo-inositol-2-amino-2-deoxy-alpha-D-glucopyranoside deacetylase
VVVAGGSANRDTMPAMPTGAPVDQLPSSEPARGPALLLVHAHPDDETISTGGVMARYAAEGVRVVCVTCTGGELGEIVVAQLDTPENHARLGEIRREELARALARLGPIESRLLGYRDSGMVGTPGNDDPGCFWRADVDEAVGRLVRIVRAVRPHVMVGYNDFGGYGHPDHVRAALITRLAFERAGDAEFQPAPSGAVSGRAWSEAAPDRAWREAESRQAAWNATPSPWQPLKRYEIVLGASRMGEMRRLLQERGIAASWDAPPDETPEQRAEREAWQARMVAAEGPVTTRVDVSDWLVAKHAALREHVTQIAPDNPFVALHPVDWRAIAPTEDFTLRESRIGVRIPEDDLLAGVR